MTDTSANAWVSSTHRPMGFREFVALVAAIMALNPLAMDLMLPALPNVAAAFHIGDANRVQAVLSVFLTGFGAGQFVMGPLSDRFGRRPILLGGLIVYGIASLLAIIAPTFETLLLARAMQGLGTAASRVIATSIVRDCYSGRRMASVVSLAMMIFISVPVIAPSIGQAIMLLGEWHGIFIVLLVFGLLTLGWIVLRLPETLPLSERKSLAVGEVTRNFRQALTNRQTFGYALAAGSVQGILFGYVLSSQQIFTGIYGLGHYFPLAFATIAIGIAVAGFLNSRIVGRYGMRVISHTALIGQLAVAVLMLTAALAGWLPLALLMVLATASLFTFGLMFSNFSALAMEPQGHIAGTASSLFGSITTLIGIAVGSAIGQYFDGTLVPLATGALLSAVLALAVVLVVEKGRLFTPHNAPV
ncbi:multidrug effflux MFS transporter [Bradyrhizobium sp. G127]|jgi:DHA1 family bicyclomycin/chloramphenicol resistance-like MFS transporter|uniref:multidrug effflux MFS transporter n=1 Tax=Bradyrhizobium sp. G127 TaxID=2904800 RepID=UPI001F3296D6|nr:multidrug effflux MFS transporter [Bradyrhizobium sp. G127]MCF2522966.1 multidrug effflux MFS transporter [Bradyrhizobium sp. G127]